MTTNEFLAKGKKEYGGIFEPVLRYAAGILRRDVEDMGNCLDILEELDNYSY